MKNVRKCPTCDRRIERISGCDHMVCGKDTGGSVQQGGCGRSFDWSAATKCNDEEHEGTLLVVFTKHVCHGPGFRQLPTVSDVL